MRNNAKSLSVLLALFLGSAAYAQAPNPGFREQPDETLPAFESGAALSGAAPDNVNLFTGDPSIAIPLGSGYPLSPAFRWQPALHYSVKSWRLEPKGCSYPHPTEPNQFVDNQYARVRGFPGVGYGWTFHMGMVATNMPLRGYVYYSPDGGEHDFMGDSPYFPGPPSLNPGAGSFRTVSSSKYRLTVLPGEYVITAPDGTTYHHMQAFTFPGPAGPAQQARDYTDFTTSGVDQHAQMMGLSHINDRFGNRVLTVNYGSAPKHWRIESITIEGGGLAASTIALTWSPLSIATPNGPLTWDVITNISLPAFEGRTLNATLTYNMTGGEGSGTDRSIRRNGYDTANGAHPSCPASPTHVFVPFLDEVSFSEGSTPAPLDPKTPIRTYRFAYKFASESNGYDTTHEGVLRKMTIPTGGVVEYTYGFTTPGPHYFNYDLQRDETDLPSPTGPAAPPPPPDYPEIQAPTDDSPAVISRTESFVSASGLANYSSTTTFSRVQSAQLTPFNLAVSSVARRVVVKRPSGNGSDVLATMHIFAVPQEKGAQAGGLELERRVYEGPTAAGPPIRTTIFGYEGAEMLLCVSPCTPGWSGRSTVAGYKNPDGFSRYKWVADVLPVSEATWYGAAPASQTVCDANNATPIACTTTLSTLYNSEALAHTTSTSYAFPAGSNGLWTPGHLSRASTTAWTNVGPKWIFGLYGSKAQSDSWTALSGGCSAERSPCSTSTSSTFDEFGRLTYRSVSAGSRSLAVEYSVPDGQGAFKEERLFAPSSDGTLTTDEIKTVRTFQRGLVTSRVVSSPTLASPDFASVFLDRDPTTGLVKSAYESYKANDTNRRTDFRFDALGKLGKILPPGSGATSDPDRKAKFSKPTWICYDMGQSYTTKDAITIFREWDRPCLSFQDAPLLPTPADQSDMPTLRYHYDGFGRMVMEEKYVPSSKADLRIGRRLTKYLPNGAVGSQSTWADVACNLPPGSPVGCTPDLPLAGQFTTYSTSSNFDPFGRARLMTQPDGSVTNLSFADGLITHSDTKTTETLSGISGPSGASVTRVETTQRDLLGHVLSVTQAASGAVTQPAFTTTYAYNGLDKLTRVVQPGLSNREFNYDEMGVLRSETTPEAGTTTYARHNVLGNVLRKVLPDNTEVESEYDALGRLKRVFTPGSKGAETNWIVNEYDGEVTDLLGRATFQRGKLTQQTSINAQPNPTSSPVLTVIQRNAYTDERDGALGSRTTEVKNGGSSLILLNESWRYNDLGLVETYSHPRRSSDPAMIVTNKYRQGQPTRVSANGLPVVSDVLYYPWGGVKEYSLGPTLSQGFRSRVTIGEDASRMPRPANIEVTSGVGIAGALGNYLYDSDGNIKAIGGDSYAYDGRSRLIGSSQVNPAGGMANRTYQYDDLGNMTHHGTQELGPYTNNRLPVSRGFQYDQRGNVTTLPSGVMGTAESLTWDPLDRIVSAQRGGTTWSYYYDSTGERIGKGNHGVTPTQTYFTLRNPANQIATEYLRETEPKLKRDNFFLGNLMVGSRRWCSAPGEGADDANWQYYAGDHLGSTWFTSVKGGEELASARVKYYPYGDLLSPTTPPTLQRHGFAGMEQDREELGYSRYQAHARSHEGKLGRFLSPDAVFGTAGDPDSWNRYSYCGGNPVTRNDPDGNVWKVATTAWKVGKAVYKGQDVANAVIGITRSTAVLFSMDSSVGTGARLAATGNLLLELSGANDVKSIAKAGVSWAKDAGKLGDAIHNSRVSGIISPGDSAARTAGSNFDTARRQAFEKAGMTDPADVKFSKVDPTTGTVVEFKGKDGAKVAYDGPHDSPGPSHDVPHVGWQTGGKRSSGGAERGNIPYDGPQHPSRSKVKGDGDL